MPLPKDVREKVEKRLREYCESKVPPELRDEVRVGFKVRGNFVTIFEKKPTFFDPSEWVDIVVAQFRYDSKSRQWTLYCADRNSRWHKYYYLDPDKDFEVLLREVEEDPTCIFWG
jgi:hypothetical protein